MRVKRDCVAGLMFIRDCLLRHPLGAGGEQAVAPPVSRPYSTARTCPAGRCLTGRGHWKVWTASSTTTGAARPKRQASLDSGRVRRFRLQVDWRIKETRSSTRASVTSCRTDTCRISTERNAVFPPGLRLRHHAERPRKKARSTSGAPSVPGNCTTTGWTAVCGRGSRRGDTRTQADNPVGEWNHFEITMRATA